MESCASHPAGPDNEAGHDGSIGGYRITGDLNSGNSGPGGRDSHDSRDSSQAGGAAGGWDIRPATPADWPALHQVDDAAFHTDTSAEIAGVMRSVSEIERMLCVRDRGQPVGIAGAFTFRMTVPGGELPGARVSWVAVLPTHRRRGILRQMMRRQLDGLREDGGEAIAVLTASEPAIYGRFGYGLASRDLRLNIARGAALSAAGAADPALELRLADPTEALERTSALYASLLPTRPGLIARSPAWERALISDLHGFPGKSSALRCVLALDAGELRGYARYRLSKDEPHQVLTQEVCAADPAAHATLWRFLLDIDLTASVRVSSLALDDPLLRLLADFPAASPRLGDGVYLRLVDLPRALGGRGYRVPVDAVLEVADAFCPWNAGRWRLAGDERGGQCERTTAPADLRLDVRELGSAYLGDASLHGLGAAGLVAEERPGALAAVSAAFGTDPLPWLPFQF